MLSSVLCSCGVIDALALDLPIIRFRCLTPRWNGPGMLRQKQETV